MKPSTTLGNHQRTNLFLLEKFLNKHELEVQDVGDYIPSFFHFNNPDLTIKYLNKNGCEWIGHSTQEINEMGYSFFRKYIHPSTLRNVFPRFLQFFNEGNPHRTLCDFQRILDPKDNEYKTCFTVSKVYKDRSGLLTITQPLDQIASYNRKINRIIEEDKYVKTNHVRYESLTDREIEITKLLLRGLNNPKIADRLFISRRTVEQHRKNINRKLDISSYADLYRFGYAFDLV